MADRDGHLEGIVVQIYGEEYRIAGTDAAQVQKMAAYVDGKMREIAALHAGPVPKAKLAVLAAMTIADELFQAMHEQNRLAETAQENLERLTRLVDERADMFSSMLERASSPLQRLLREQSVQQPGSPAVE